MNAISTPSDKDAGLAHVLAVARGDGAVAMYDVRTSSQRGAPRGRETAAAATQGALCMLRPEQGGFAPVNAV